MGAASLLLALALSADHAFAFTSFHAELRGRRTLLGSVSHNLDLLLQPEVDTGLVSGLWRWRAAYRPQLSFPKLRQPELLHRIEAGGEWRFAHGQRALVDQQFSFGQYDTSLGNLGGSGGALPDTILPLATVDYLQSNTSFALDGTLAPRLGMRAALGYRASGGLTESARRTIPLRHGPYLALDLRHAATRREELSTQLGLSAERNSGGRTAGIAEGVVALRSVLSRQAALHLGAGAAAVASTAAGEELVQSAVPVALASFSYGLPRLRLTLESRLSPQVDALSGLVFQRAGAGLSSEYHPRSDYTVRASFGGSWAVAGQNAGDRSLLGEASVAYHQGSLEVSASLHLADMVVARSAVPHGRELRVQVGVTLLGQERR